MLNKGIVQDFHNLLYKSYIIIRRSIGILAVLLPLLLVLGGLVSKDENLVQRSLSAYYHNNMRDVFVTVLAMAAFLLIAYRGRTCIVRVLTTVSGILALFIIAFPTEVKNPPIIPYGIFELPSYPSMLIHNISAILFFILLGFISFFHFTSHLDSTPESRRKNDKWYRIFGTVMFMAATYMIFFVIAFPNYNVLVAEFIGLEALGFTWLFKGWKRESVMKKNPSVNRRRKYKWLRYSRYWKH
ncbi:MAG: hypothetical protein GY760_11090 [Deltaproteobacteria bacterium]|nr:hypothetical protein [Deltaproteobacteria bacterium]